MAVGAGKSTGEDLPRPEGRQTLRVTANTVLQLLGDPRWWPRDLRMPRGRVLWRTIEGADPDSWPPPATAAGRCDLLKGLAKAQYDETRAWFLVVTYLYVGSAIFAGLALLVEPANEGFTAAAAISSVVAALARIRATRLHGIAHEAHWRALLLDSLGPTDPELTRAALIENTISDGARRRAGPVVDDFTSKEAPGQERLIENLQQTAFITGALFGGAKVQALFLSSVVVIVPLSGTIFWLSTGKAWPVELGVLAITAVLPLWDVIGRQRSWNEGENTLERVVQSLENVSETRDVLPLLVDAMTATAMAPPIPRTVSARWLKEGVVDRWRLLAALDGRHPPAPDPPSEDSPPPDPPPEDAPLPDPPPEDPPEPD